MIKTPLRPYQEAACRRAITHLSNPGGGGFLIFAQQRTGKCLIVFKIAEKIRPKRILILCPKNAIREWREQQRKHCSRLIPMTVINYERAVAHRMHWYKWCKTNPETLLVADESHYMKTRGRARSRVARKMARKCRYRLALSGTPIAQGAVDGWAQFDFADPKIFGRYDDRIDKETKQLLEIGFATRYLIWGGYKNHTLVGLRNEDEFNRIFHKHSYRITLREAQQAAGNKGVVLNYRKEYCELETSSLRVYNEIQTDLETVVNQRKIRVKNVLAVVSKLQQITGGWIITPRSVGAERRILRVGKEKSEKLHEVVRSLPSRTRFIVVCRFIHEIDSVVSFLQRFGYSVAKVCGGSPYTGKFTTDVIVMQIQSGIAVDMSRASTIIFYSTDYSYITFSQAQFRILSYDKSSAKYIFLLARNTVDEVIYEALIRKKKVADLIVDRYRKKEQNSAITEQ